MRKREWMFGDVEDNYRLIFGHCLVLRSDYREKVKEAGNGITRKGRLRNFVGDDFIKALIQLFPSPQLR